MKHPRFDSTAGLAERCGVARSHLTNSRVAGALLNIFFICIKRIENVYMKNE